ncbi:MAG: 5-(carboxyamino)imidazole ribonucleotide mutase [Caldisericia bacterium]|nr:5-(carboxyamino)imidazole ribonucleotide mutase [Caldisericia bacterium]
MSKLIGVLMGSDSDYKYVEKALKILSAYNIAFDVSVISAHRDTESALEYAKYAKQNGLKVIIAFAGMAAHLAGVVAANTTLPVIGVPLDRTGFGGQDALLSTVQMPPGIPVATVGVDAGANAAWLAIRILALLDKTIQEKLDEEKDLMKKKLIEKTKKVREMWNNE